MKFPILVIGFNRPEKLKMVIEKIINENREIYIALDGPRESNMQDMLKVKECVDIIENYQKERMINTLYQQQNLGCKEGEQSAMNWFFENNEAGIILEDDILIEKEFLKFCDENLIKYKNDERIWAICGFIPFEIESLDSKTANKKFFTCDTPQTWGWASWRRVWDKYQNEININEFKHIKYPEIFYGGKFRINRNIWERRFLDLINERVSTWDYQFTLSCWNNQGVNIFPYKNYVNNIGFDSEATHTLIKPHKSSEIVKIENIDFSTEFHNFDRVNYLKFNFVRKYLSLKIQELNLRLRNAKI
jgi:hypothetical protein